MRHRNLRRRLAAAAALLLAALGACPRAPEIRPRVEGGLVLAGFEDVSDWPGLERSTRVAAAGDASGRWSAMDERPGICCTAIPHDWSAYNALSLWVYNRRRLESTAFMMILRSENAKTEGMDYYALRLDLGTWTGWKRFLVPFAELGAARQPIGWSRIDSVEFTASGWANTPNPKAVVCFDDLRLLKLPKVEGPRMTDDELFAAMNLRHRGMGAVRAAVKSGDLEAAKAAWLEHLRTRVHPRWFIDWRERPKPHGPPPTGGSEGWDYFQRTLTVDWTGWKHFQLAKADFGKGREPIGWNWIRSIAINASGWGHTPDPRTVLYFDDVQLVGKDTSVGLGDFEAGTGNWQGLTRSDEQARSGRFSGKWHLMHVNTSIRLGDIPTDWTAFDALEFWCYAPEATGAKMQIVLDSDQPAAGQADAILKHIIKGHDFGPDIDWSADPHNYREWTYAINRFYHWRTLAEAYWDTSDEKYAREFCDQLQDWVRKNPVPLLVSGNGSYTWRTIECGIRQSTTWPDCLYRLLGSESFTPEAAAVMTRSMVEHARHLMTWSSPGSNWITMESNGLGTLGILLPEFREAKAWRETAIGRMHAELDSQVYPDGAQIELTTGYHQVSLNNFLGLARTAKLNAVPLPRDYYAKLRRMFDYNLFVQMPDGRTPALNDGGMGSIRQSMATAHELYGDPVFEWAATGGAAGTPPDHRLPLRESLPRKQRQGGSLPKGQTANAPRGAGSDGTSHLFPYAGQMVMRSGWEPDARYLLLDAGPFGYGHQHEDKLSIVVHALGKLHIIDPGNYAYDSSPWRRYTIDTPAHNTILVDGLPQRRRGKPRSEYVVKEPLPTNRWLTSDRLDYAAGQYDEGYGDGHQVRVVHRREVVFVKPLYWLVVDTLTGEGEHLYESLFHFDADEAEADGLTVRTTDPTPNCLIAAAPQPGLQARIVKGQTKPTLQGFVAAQRWRPSWKAPEATPPEHGKREVPTAVFALRAKAPVRMAYVIYPYSQGETPRLIVEDLTAERRPVRFRATLPDGTVDEIMIEKGVAVLRTAPGGRPEPWARLEF